MSPTLIFTPSAKHVEAGASVSVEVRRRHGSAIYALRLKSDPTCCVFVTLTRIAEQGSLWHALDSLATECLVNSERAGTGKFLANKLSTDFRNCHRLMEHLYI